MSWPFRVPESADGNPPLPHGWFWRRERRGRISAHNGRGGSMGGPDMWVICIQVWMDYAFGLSTQLARSRAENLRLANELSWADEKRPTDAKKEASHD